MSDHSMIVWRFGIPSRIAESPADDCPLGLTKEKVDLETDPDYTVSVAPILREYLPRHKDITRDPGHMSLQTSMQGLETEKKRTRARPATYVVRTKGKRGRQLSKMAVVAGNVTKQIPGSAVPAVNYSGISTATSRR
jgi:hypothetical protein